MARVKEPGHSFADGIMEAPMLFEHGGTILGRHAIDVHGNLDHSAIEDAEGVEKVFDLAGSGSTEL